MSKYSGKMDGTGRKGPDRPNKGIARMMRGVKRSEAEARNAQTPDNRKRANARTLGFNRNSDIPTSQLPPIVRGNDVDTFYGADDDQAYAIEFWDAKD